MSQHKCNYPNGPQQLTPVGGGDTPVASAYENWEPDCGWIYLNAPGTFTDKDFRVGFRIGQRNSYTYACDLGSAFGPWMYTPWATSGGGSTQFTDYGAMGTGWVPGYDKDPDCYQLRLDTRDSPGWQFTNVKLYLYLAEDNYSKFHYMQSGWNPDGSQGSTMTAGGWSGQVTAGGSDTPDVGKVIMYATPTQYSNVQNSGWKRKFSLPGGGLGDCYDANSNAYPGSAYLGSLNRGDGSFDYNCDGSQTGTSDYLAGAEDSAGYGDGCTGTDGWVSGVPACGASASYGGYQWWSPTPCSNCGGVMLPKLPQSTLSSIFGIKTAYAMPCCGEDICKMVSHSQVRNCR